METNLKNKTTDEKIEYLKNVLNDENNDDLIISLNIFNLLKKGNAWDNSFFEHPDILFNNILEFITIKNALNKELEMFVRKLLNIYYNCLHHCSEIISTSSAKVVPTLYNNILLQADFQFMSSLSLEYNFTQFEDTTYANSFSIILPMANKLSIFGKLATNMIVSSDGVEKNDSTSK